MTVKDLIEKLQALPQDAEIRIVPNDCEHVSEWWVEPAFCTYVPDDEYPKGVVEIVGGPSKQGGK